MSFSIFSPIFTIFLGLIESWLYEISPITDRFEYVSSILTNELALSEIHYSTLLSYNENWLNNSGYSEYFSLTQTSECNVNDNVHDDITLIFTFFWKTHVLRRATVEKFRSKLISIWTWLAICRLQRHLLLLWRLELLFVEFEINFNSVAYNCLM